jgi:hypothetical protein
MIPREDIVLAIAAEVALNVSAVPGRLEMKWEADDRKADLMVQRIVHAVNVRLRFIDTRGNRVDARKLCRQIVIDILARKENLAPYHEYIDKFALRNDKDFMTRLGRGFDQRKAVFDDL